MLRSVRARATFIAVVATAAALVIAAVLLMFVVRSTLVSEIDRSISNRAFDIAAEIDITDVVDNAAFPSDPETFAAVLGYDFDYDDFDDDDFDDGDLELDFDDDDFESDDSDFDDSELGVVSGGDGFIPAVVVHNDVAPDAAEIISQLPGSATLDLGLIRTGEPVNANVASISRTEGADNLRMVAQPVGTGDEVAVVARTLDGVDRTVATIRWWALAAVPLLSTLVGLLVWLLTGRALRPVEEIRREAELISANDLSRRVSVDARGDEIGRLGTTVNAMLDRIAKGQERQQRFASDAAHELRSPLASMRALLDVDQAHPDTVNWEHSAARLDVETSRMQRLVEDLLMLTRSELPTVAPSLVDVDDLILAEVTSQRSASCTVDPTAVSACTVRGNPDQLRRVINNLVSNAIRHADAKVAIASSVIDGKAVVTVDDDGAGIAIADRERIFERFERLDEARTRDAGGTGLGLALAREITLAHGGTLTVHDSPLGGAQFRLELPAS